MNWQHLEARNRAYITCLDDQDWPSLGRFVAVDVRYNGEAIGFDGYRAMLIGSYRDIPIWRSASASSSPTEQPSLPG